MKALVLGAVLLVVLAPAAAAVALESDDPATIAAFTEAESEEPGTDTPATTVVSEGGVQPAELAPPAEVDVREDQWPAKYLAPAVALLGGLGVVASLALYGVRLRAKYRVVE